MAAPRALGDLAVLITESWKGIDSQWPRLFWGSKGVSSRGLFALFLLQFTT